RIILHEDANRKPQIYIDNLTIAEIEAKIESHDNSLFFERFFNSIFTPIEQQRTMLYLLRLKQALEEVKAALANDNLGFTANLDIKYVRQSRESSSCSSLPRYQLLYNDRLVRIEPANSGQLNDLLLKIAELNSPLFDNLSNKKLKE